MSEPNRTTIKLEQNIQAHEGVLSEIVLRDPKYGDYRELGEVWTVTYDANGRGVPVYLEAVAFGYVERCVVVPKSALLLEQLSLSDARKLRQWVDRFFRSGAEETEDSTTSSKTSSGESAASPSTPS